MNSKCSKSIVRCWKWDAYHQLADENRCECAVATEKIAKKPQFMTVKMFDHVQMVICWYSMRFTTAQWKIEHTDLQRQIVIRTYIYTFSVCKRVRLCAWMSDVSVLLYVKYDHALELMQIMKPRKRAKKLYHNKNRMPNDICTNAKPNIESYKKHKTQSIVF